VCERYWILSNFFVIEIWIKLHNSKKNWVKIGFQTLGWIKVCFIFFIFKFHQLGRQHKPHKLGFQSECTKWCLWHPCCKEGRGALSLSSHTRHVVPTHTTHEWLSKQVCFCQVYSKLFISKRNRFHWLCRKGGETSHRCTTNSRIGIISFCLNWTPICKSQAKRGGSLFVFSKYPHYCSEDIIFPPNYKQEKCQNLFKFMNILKFRQSSKKKYCIGCSTSCVIHNGLAINLISTIDVVW
jgi:hypothetical protein